MRRDLTDEQYEELLWLSNDRPLGSAIETGHLQYAIEKTKLKDPSLMKLIKKYEQASKRLQRYLKEAYDLKFSGVV